MVKRVIVTIALFCAILLLASCARQGATETPLDTAAALKQVQTGSQGIEVSLLPNFPPPTLYDQD